MYRSLCEKFPRDIANYISKFRDYGQIENEDYQIVIGSIDPRPENARRFCSGGDFWSQVDNECNWIQYIRELGISGFVELCELSRDVIEIVYLRNAFEESDYDEYVYDSLAYGKRHNRIYKRIYARIARQLGNLWLETYICYRRQILNAVFAEQVTLNAGEAD